MAQIAAVILAGGQGNRLGGADKARLKIGGKMLIERVKERLPARINPILVSRHALRADDSLAFQGMTQVMDLPIPFTGPLAGIGAAIAGLQAGIMPDFLLSVAGDTPFFPADFLERMLPALKGYDAVAAQYKGQIYPTNALWRLEKLQLLPERLRNGSAPSGPMALLKEMKWRSVDWETMISHDPFLNINTLKDIINLNRHALSAREM